MSSTLDVVWRDSPSYENARVGRVFNHRRPDRYPQGVVQPKTAAEVASAVKLAKEMNLRVSVRSGGHSWAAWSVRDDALLIDLGNLKCLELNEATGIVKASPSTTGRVLNKYLSTKGKMFVSSNYSRQIGSTLILDDRPGGIVPTSAWVMNLISQSPTDSITKRTQVVFFSKVAWAGIARCVYFTSQNLTVADHMNRTGAGPAKK
jgi:hypothetical protein